MFPHPQNQQEAVKLNMKKQIRQEGNLWACVVVLGSVASNVIALVLSFLPYTIQNYINSDMGQLWTQIIYSIAVFTLPYFIVLAIRKQKITDLVNFKWKKPSLSWPLIMLALGASMVVNVLTSQFTSLLDAYGITVTAPNLAIPQGVFGASLYLFALTVVPAVVEEFAFRGVILGSLKKYGSGYAIVVSSVLFGLMHGNIVQIPFAAVFGLVVGYIALATDSIIPCIIIHFLNNFVAGVEQITNQYASDRVSTVVVYGCFLLYLVLGVIGFVMICKKYERPFDNIKEKSALTVAESSKAAMLGAGFIIAMIYFGGAACLLL